MAPLISTQSLSKSYGKVTALADVTLSALPGSLGLVGPNGAGKTTLIRILMGLAHPDRGEVRLFGLDPAKDAKRVRARVGFVPEDDAYWEGLSAVGAVQFAGRLSGLAASDALKRAHRLLDEAGLEEERYRLMETLSMGMRQKVRLAQGLVHTPELLILDEPSRFLDPQARTAFTEWAGRLQKQGTSILISTHELGDIEKLCDRAILLVEGRLKAQIDLPDLLKRSDQWELQPIGEMEKATAAMRSIGITPEIDNDTFLFMMGDNDCTKIVFEFNKRKIGIRRLSRITPSLVDILPQFLSRPR